MILNNEDASLKLSDVKIVLDKKDSIVIDNYGDLEYNGAIIESNSENIKAIYNRENGSIDIKDGSITLSGQGVTIIYSESIKDINIEDGQLITTNAYVSTVQQAIENKSTGKIFMSGYQQIIML